MIEQKAESLRPALEELTRQAAQGEVAHNDDTGMRILRLAREPGDKRTGTFTSGIVSIVGVWRIALYFTGPKHAGENIAEVLRQRVRELPAPIQMSFRATRRRSKEWNLCRRTASPMEGGSLWKWWRTFQRNAATFWRHWGAYITTTGWRGNRNCRRRIGCFSIRSAAVL